jgi:hypothetical protein
MCLATGWSYVWFNGLVALWTVQEQEPDPTSDPARPRISALDIFFHWSFKLFCSIGAGFAVGVGVVAYIVVLVSFVNDMTPTAAKSVVKHLKRWIGAEDSGSTEDISFTSLMLALPLTHPTTRTGKILKHC